MLCLLGGASFHVYMDRSLVLQAKVLSLHSGMNYCLTQFLLKRFVQISCYFSYLLAHLYEFACLWFQTNSHYKFSYRRVRSVPEQYQDHDSVKYLPAKKMKSYAHIRKYAVRIRGNTVEWICVNVMKPAKETIKSNSQCIHTVKVTYDGKYK